MYVTSLCLDIYEVAFNKKNNQTINYSEMLELEKILFKYYLRFLCS